MRLLLLSSPPYLQQVQFPPLFSGSRQPALDKNQFYMWNSVLSLEFQQFSLPGSPASISLPENIIARANCLVAFFFLYFAPLTKIKKPKFLNKLLLRKYIL